LLLRRAGIAITAGGGIIGVTGTGAAGNGERDILAITA
jgi:hypothetical protein